MGIKNAITYNSILELFSSDDRFTLNTVKTINTTEMVM